MRDQLRFLARAGTWRAISLLAVVVSLTSTGLGAQPRTDNFERALRFLDAVFPQLKGQQHGVALSNNYWRNYDAPLHPLRSFALLISPAGAPDGQLLLTAHFEFTTDDYVDEFLVGADTLLQRQARHRIVELVRQQPAISKEGVGSALTEAGARFGPTQENEFRRLAVTKLQALRFAIGASKLTSVEWLQVDDAIWRVGLEARQSGHTYDYTALFEPFQGYLFVLKRGALHNRRPQ